MISSSSMSRRWFCITFGTIVLLSAVFRFWQLGQVPVSVYWDEVAMMVDIKSVLSTGLDMHGRPWYQLIYPSYGDYKLPVYIWAATASSKLFGLSEFSLRLPSAISGVLTVIVSGLLARVLFRLVVRNTYSSKFLDTLQLFVMVVVSTSPWSLMFSRTAFEGHVGQALLGTSMLLAAYGLLKKNTWIFLLSPVFGALATYTYYSVRFVWLAVFVGLCLLHFSQKFSAERGQAIQRLTKLKIELAQMILGTFIFIICLVPLLNSPLAKDADRFRLGTDSVLNNTNLVIQSNIYREIAGNTNIDRLFYNHWWLMLRELFKNISDNTSPLFMFVNGDPNLRHGTTQFGLFFIILLPAFVIGSVLLLKRHLALAVFILSWWTVALLPASVPENTPHALRSLNALVPLCIVIGFGTSWIWEKVSHTGIKFTMSLFFGISLINFLSFYTAVYPKLSANDWQSGFKPFSKAVFEAQQAQSIVYVEGFDDRFYLWLMAYGPYGGDTFHKWPTNNYKFVSSGIPNNFPNILFALPKDEQLIQDIQENKRPVIAGRTTEIATRCATATLYTCQLISITDETGTPKFVVAQLQAK